MLTVLAYVLVIPLSSFVMTIAMILTGYPIALALAWASIGVQTKVAGFLGGIGGVAAAIAFGFIIFHWFVGPDSYTLLPFLASVVPLGIPIANDCAQARRVKEARELMLTTLEENRSDAMTTISDSSKTAHGSSVLGELFAVVLACIWFFSQ